MAKAGSSNEYTPTGKSAANSMSEHEKNLLVFASHAACFVFALDVNFVMPSNE